jgi:FMN phosphatase YigB (HAD superfamily)
MYHDALARLGVVREGAGFVGHEARQLDGARAAGLITFAVYHDRDAQADYPLRSLGELPRLVG